LFLATGDPASRSIHQGHVATLDNACQTAATQVSPFTTRCTDTLMPAKFSRIAPLGI
jgi:hypothetical protein